MFGEVPMQKAWRSVQRLCSEAWLLTWLTIILISHFRVGYQWINRMVLTFLYAGLLSPAILQILWYYVSSGKVLRSVQYGKEPRNFLDIYLPTSEGRKATGNTTILYIPGGAWIIGYKGWAALLGRWLSAMGYIFIAVDHRNFPQGTISDMIQDVTAAVTWTLAHVHQYGGDRSQVVVMGQSSGAHALMLSLLQQLHTFGQDSEGGDEASKDYLEEQEPEAWQPSALKLVIAVSGAYNVQTLVEHFDQRGLYRRVFMSIMEAGLTGSRAHEALPKHSPVQLLQNRRHLSVAAVKKLPSLLLVHGTADRTIPFTQTEQMAAALTANGVRCGVELLEGSSHTDPIMEDLLLWGGAAPLLRLIRRIAPLPRSEIPPALPSPQNSPALTTSTTTSTLERRRGGRVTGSATGPTSAPSSASTNVGTAQGSAVPGDTGILRDAAKFQGGDERAAGAGSKVVADSLPRASLDGYCFDGRHNGGANGGVAGPTGQGVGPKLDAVWMPSPLVHLARLVVPF